MRNGVGKKEGRKEGKTPPPRLCPLFLILIEPCVQQQPARKASPAEREPAGDGQASANTTSDRGLLSALVVVVEDAVGQLSD